MPNYGKCGIITQGTIDEKTLAAIERELTAGHVVELFKLRDGTLKIRTVRKKEISIPTA